MYTYRFRIRVACNDRGPGYTCSLFMDDRLEYSAMTCPGHQDLKELPEPHVINIFQHLLLYSCWWLHSSCCEFRLNCLQPEVSWPHLSWLTQPGATSGMDAVLLTVLPACAVSPGMLLHFSLSKICAPSLSSILISSMKTPD
ncbi:hypothetical protein HJG60_010511 [Phyllostomus discolor]|uniref:Uncharacterized protein n=1 Tax=Phyllostomus discolor TaxID=89673 RepID=A0A834ALG2_9CHIR|nr:hypothetical protein HJG60_010511 [Phyllostomus discolor]